MNHHTQILIIQRKPPPKSTSKLPREERETAQHLATTFSPPKSKIRIHMLACGQRHLSAETKLQSTNIPRIATPLSPPPQTKVSFFLLERRNSGGGIQTHLVMPRLPSSVANQVWVRKIQTSFFRMEMCRCTFHLKTIRNKNSN